MSDGTPSAVDPAARGVPDAEILRRIAALRESLSPAEARVAAVVLAAPAWVLESPLSTLAGRAEVSDPTVIRFCRSLGFDGYQTFRLRLAHSLGSGASFLPLTPTRIVDTRNGTGGFNSPLGQGAPMVVTVAGNGGVPGMATATPPKAVVLNVTVEGATMASDLAVWPDGGGRPVASDLNFVGGQTVPNLVIVKLSAAGKIDIGNDFGATDVIVDVVGWYG